MFRPPALPPKGGPLFRTLGGRGRKQLTAERMTRDAGLLTRIGCHSSRAIGIAGGSSNTPSRWPRTTKLYDRRSDQVTLDQVERIVL